MPPDIGDEAKRFGVDLFSPRYASGGPRGLEVKPWYFHQPAFK
jgi:hypothetical protein